MINRWEHRQYVKDLDEDEDMTQAAVGRLGQAGWEMVAWTPLHEVRGDVLPESFWFKRQKI